MNHDAPPWATEILERLERIERALLIAPPVPRTQPYTTAEMMVLLNFPPTSKGRFWTTVHAQRVPFTRINARKVVFHRAAVDAWLAKRARHAT